jgi:ribose transport system permease protein
MLFLAKDKILGIPVALVVWAAVSSSSCAADADRLRPLDLRHRQRARARPISPASAPASSSSAPSSLQPVRLDRRRAAGRLFDQGLSGHGQRLPAAGHRRGRPRRHAYSRRRGRYIGTLVGVILIVLLNSVLSIMQMPEAGRQIIYGSVIIGMLLVYGRNQRVTS